MHHLSICAGIGGLDLGLKRAIPALRTIAMVEREAFCIANLASQIEAGDWMLALSSQTWSGSLGENFLESWTSFLVASRVSPSAMPANATELKTSDTSGRTSETEFLFSEMESASSRTSTESPVQSHRDITPFSTMCSATWKNGFHSNGRMLHSGRSWGASSPETLVHTRGQRPSQRKVSQCQRYGPHRQRRRTFIRICNYAQRLGDVCRDRARHPTH